MVNKILRKRTIDIDRNGRQGEILLIRCAFGFYVVWRYHWDEDDFVACNTRRFDNVSAALRAYRFDTCSDFEEVPF